MVALPAWRSANAAGDFPIPTVLGSRAVGAAAVACAVGVSVTFGRRTKGTGAKIAAVAVNALVVLAAIAALDTAQSRLARVQYVQVPTPVATSQLTSRHGPVTNILPYSRDGKPLTDVLLFDQDGRPLRTAFQQWWPDGCERSIEYPKAADGVAVEFAYPMQYVLGPGVSGSCAPNMERPPVPLPTFPAEPVAAAPAGN